MKTGLRNKVVLITGASGGIGMAIARAFAAEGARLVLHYHRQAARVRKLQQQLGGTKALAVQADLTREPEVEELFAQAMRKFGRMDTLVANAGVWPETDVPIHKMTLAQWQGTIDTDLTSVFLCCRAFFRCVEHQCQGNAVLVSSTAGVFGEPGHADYAAAKSALAYGVLLSLKNEIGRLAPPSLKYPGGRVNCVCPGWTVTPMTAQHMGDPEKVRRALATRALPRVAGVADVANAVLFLASDILAGHITGQRLTIAGGMEGRWLWLPEEIRLQAGLGVPR